MYTLKQIMEMLSIPERTIRRHLQSGILKGSKVGGVWKFDDEQLKDYLSSDKIIKTMSVTRMNEILDYLNGFSQSDNQILIIKQYPKTKIKDNANITNIINNMKTPFFFDLFNSGNKTIVTLRGNEEEVLDVINQINNYLN